MMLTAVKALGKMRPTTMLVIPCIPKAVKSATVVELTDAIVAATSV